MSDTWVKTERLGGATDKLVFEEFGKILNAIYDLAGRGAAVDLGCGEAHVTKSWGMCTLIDLVARPYVGRTMEQMDIRWGPELFRRDNRRFNLTVMTDVIEHLLPDDALKLLADLEPFTKATVIFTPCGPWRMEPTATDPDSHKSSWVPGDFAAKAWTVWEWPSFHGPVDGQILGAFWAWRFRDGQPTVQAVAERAGVAI